MTKKSKKPELVEPEDGPPLFNENKSWSITLGLYPGLLFGFRSYLGGASSIHVLYLPFIDIALEIDN